MTEEVKKRIDDINNGIVPEGYKRVGKDIIPDDWEQRELGSISEKVTKKNQDLECDEVLTNSAEYGIISQKEFFDKEIANSENIDGYYIVEPNDFVYNPRISTLAPFGPIRRNKLEKSGAMSPLYYVFRTHDVDYGYLEYYFKTTGWHSFMHLNGNSGARADRFAIRDDVFKKMPILLPKDIAEQRAIGEFFQNLDNTITLHQRKCDELKNLKKAYLTKMFPQKGQKRPEIRFSGFTDDWEQRKLKEVCSEFQSGKSIKSSEIYETGEYKVYGGNGLRGYTNTYNHDGDYALIGRQGALCGNMNYSTGKAYFTEHAVAVQGNESNDTLFLYYLLDQMNLGQYSGQSAQPGLAVNKIIELKNYFPNLEEQKKIGAYFAELDNTITLHQRKCELLKVKKKALMQLLLTGKVRVKV